MSITVSKQHADRFTIGARVLIVPRRNWLARLWRRFMRRRDHVYAVSSITELDDEGRIVTIGTAPTEPPS